MVNNRIASRTITPEQLEECQMAAEAIKGLPNVTTEIIGCWVWAWGDTKPFANIFRTLGWHWASSKQKWCWYPSSVEYKKVRKTYADIQQTFGVTFHREKGEDEE